MLHISYCIFLSAIELRVSLRFLILCFYRWKIIRQTNSNDTENMIDILMNFNIIISSGPSCLDLGLFSVFVCSMFELCVCEYIYFICHVFYVTFLLFAVSYEITISITTLKALACNLCRAEAIIHPPTDILWNIQFQQNNKYGNDDCYYYFCSFTTMSIWFDQ